VGPLALVLAAVAALSWTWDTWPDPIVDFGREAYLPWRIASGETLYVDLAHFSGPLSPYLNATWFRLFGPSIRTLVIANLVTTAAFTALLYALLVRLADRFAATVACLAFIVMFACAQYTRIGNYNWVTPYSHELPHGVMLTIAALWCLDRHHRTGDLRFVGAMGFAAGCLVLTKAEVLLAGGLGIAAGLVLTVLIERPPAPKLGRIALVFGAALALPLVVTALAFARVMPLAEVLEWPLGHWRAAARPGLSGARFYLEGMGLDDVGANLALLATTAGWWLLVLAVGAGTAFALRRPHAGRRWWAIGLAVASTGLLYRVVSLDGWHEIARPLPVAMALVAVGGLVATWQARADRERALRAATVTALAVFALVMLAKMMLNARVFQYGFVLAMPATVVLVVALVAWLPRVLDRRGWYGEALGAVMLGAVAAFALSKITIEERLLARKTAVVGSGADRLRADDRGVGIARLLEQIRTRVAAGDTLAVLPEGALLNFIARRRNPTPYYLFDTTSALLWDEAHVARAFAEHPPDWIALIDRGDAPSGPPSFGRTRFVDLVAWVREDYEPVWQLGTPLAGNRGLAVGLLRRRAAS